MTPQFSPNIQSHSPTQHQTIQQTTTEPAVPPQVPAHPLPQPRRHHEAGARPPLRRHARAPPRALGLARQQRLRPPHRHHHRRLPPHAGARAPHGALLLPPRQRPPPPPLPHPRRACPAGLRAGGGRGGGRAAEGNVRVHHEHPQCLRLFLLPALRLGRRGRRRRQGPPGQAQRAQARGDPRGGALDGRAGAAAPHTQPLRGAAADGERRRRRRRRAAAAAAVAPVAGWAAALVARLEPRDGREPLGGGVGGGGGAGARPVVARAVGAGAVDSGGPAPPPARPGDGRADGRPRGHVRGRGQGQRQLRPAGDARGGGAVHHRALRLPARQGTHDQATGPCPFLQAQPDTQPID